MKYAQTTVLINDGSSGDRWVGSFRPMLGAWATCAAVLLASACGSDAPLDLGKASGEGKPQTETQEDNSTKPSQVPGADEGSTNVPTGGDAEGASGNDPGTDEPSATEQDQDPLAVAGSAPGYQPYDYPPGPYGITQGAIIENLEFHGWSSPVTAGYDLNQANTIRLSDFYDPTGEKGNELLLINSVAVWCGVCRAEYADLQTNQIYSQLSARGLQMLGLLFEDNDGAPARYVDLVNWGSAFSVEFPFGIDPGFKTGVYFDRSATPMNMLVDARTMQILVLITGYNPELYQAAADILTERGR